METALSQSPDFGFSLLSNEHLEDAITELAACITVATARLLSLIAELDRRQAWGDWGIKSCAHWLNWKCGIGLGAAREKVRVARAIESLPLIRESFSNGEISYSKVRAMTRVATIENEEFLLMIARHGTASHMENLVRGYRRVARNEALANANKAHAERQLNWYWDEDGSLVIKARLPAETGALVLKALEAAQNKIDLEEIQESVSAETCTESTPQAQRRADTLVEVATEYLGNKGRTAAATDRYQVVVHVTPETFCEDGIGAAAVIENGPDICAETARRLSCDTPFRLIELDADGHPLNVGRKTRVISPGMRRALVTRDGGCRFPGCTNHRHVDAHHIQHWADGGETSLNNLVLLCRHHHRLIHEGGFEVIRRDDGKLAFRKPNGELVPRCGSLTPPNMTVNDVVAAGGKNVSAETLLPEWAGETMDLGLAVEGLLVGPDPSRVSLTPD